MRAAIFDEDADRSYRRRAGTSMAPSRSMRRSLGLSCFLLLVPAAACKQDESPPPRPSGPEMSGPQSRRMANCPSAVRGAVTLTTPTPDGIDVTVTSPDLTAARQIAELAQFHARNPRPLLPFPHTGLGGGRGHAGYCPIARGDDVIITASVIPGGATIHLRARLPWRVHDLRESVVTRAERLRSFPSS
jgi:hypothetical protein